MTIDIGRIAYQAYVDDLGATHLNRWEDLGQVQQNAWRNAAVEVIQYIEKEKLSLGDKNE